MAAETVRRFGEPKVALLYLTLVPQIRCPPAKCAKRERVRGTSARSDD